MSDARGQARALTLLTRIGRGREAALRETLERLPGGEASPLARLPGTHFARLVIVGDLEPGRSHLLFGSCFDAGPADYVEALRARMPEEADAVWGHCDGYPGSGDARAFSHYMELHRLRTNLFVAAYPEATLPEVLEALEMRRRMVDLVPRAHSLAPQELRQALGEVLAPERGRERLAASA